MPLHATPFLILALFIASAAAAQAPVQLGSPVDGQLAAGSADAYAVTAAAGTFVAGRVLQHSVDAIVTVSGPDGAPVARFDDTARGAETFAFVARTAGVYTVAVAPFEDTAGQYTIRIDRSEPVATTPAGVARQRFSARDAADTPGALVAVVKDGEVIYQEAFGAANLAHGIPYALDTPTNIGSTSKQFTAYAIGLLAERGALTLDDDVRTVVPELPDFGTTVTLRHLLSHTSGYREFLNTLGAGGRRLDGTDAIDRSEVVSVVQRQPGLQNAPGAEWNYNNTGYALLSLVVERVSGESFPVWMAENVFAPLGMTHTVVKHTPGQVIPGSAQGYAASGDGWAEAQDIAAGASMGAGGIYTTLPDLARWMIALETGAADPAVVREMTTRYVLANGDTTAYGMGLFVDAFGGQRRVHHGGADTAHRAAFTMFPDLNAGVIVLTNSEFGADAQADRIARAFFPEAFASPAAAPAVAAPEATASDGPASFDPALFDDYAGRYALGAAAGFVIEFRRDEDGGYLTQATGQDAVAIVPVSDSTFAVAGVSATVTFHRGAGGVVRSATLDQGGSRNSLTRLEAETEAPLALAGLAGRYYSDELETFYTVAVADESIVLQSRRSPDATLRRTSGNTFDGPTGTLVFARSANGEATSFTLDAGGRARGIVFERTRQ